MRFQKSGILTIEFLIIPSLISPLPPPPPPRVPELNSGPPGDYTAFTVYERAAAIIILIDERGDIKNRHAKGYHIYSGYMKSGTGKIFKVLYIYTINARRHIC